MSVARSPPRCLDHPGASVSPRVEVAEGELRPLEGALPAGRTVMEGVAELFGAAGFVGGAARLSGGGIQPFRYVLPALGTDGRHPAWFSGVVAPDGPVAIEAATLTFGRKDGAPFLHCHGIWHTSGGERRMGHMLALECVVTEPIAMQGVGTADALFDAIPDTETEFVLFSPAGTDRQVTGHGTRGLLVRLRPNQDILTAIEDLAAARGIAAGRVRGIGSLNEVRFDDGRRVRSLATELMIGRGRIEVIAGCRRASLAVAAVDVDGEIHEGVLARGDNPVCVTFELVIEVLQGAPV